MGQFLHISLGLISLPGSCSLEQYFGFPIFSHKRSEQFWKQNTIAEDEIVIAIGTAAKIYQETLAIFLTP